MAAQTISLDLPKLYDYQAEALAHPARFKIIVSGRRSGKSIMDAAAAVATAAGGGQVYIVVPNYSNANTIWKYCTRYTRKLKNARILTQNKSAMEITFTTTNGYIKIATGENQSGVRGDYADLMILDELAFTRDAEELYYGVAIPMLADTAGSMIVTSTPNGTGDTLHALYLAAKADTSGRMAAWRWPTTQNPSALIRADAELARLTMPKRRYRQEILASFESSEDGVFQNVQACATAEPQDAAIAGHQYVAGADWGRTHDATVICIYDISLGALVFMDRFVGLPFASQVERIKTTCNHFQPTTLLAEENSFGQAIIEMLRTADVPVQPFQMTNTTKQQLVDSFQTALEFGNIRIIPDELLVGELEAYRGTRLASGRTRYDAPSGFHDDSVIAAMLAYHAGTNAPRDATVFSYWEAMTTEPQIRPRRRGKYAHLNEFYR